MTKILKYFTWVHTCSQELEFGKCPTSRHCITSYVKITAYASNHRLLIRVISSTGSSFARHCNVFFFSSEVNYGYFSQRVFFQKQKVARMTLHICLRMIWAFTCVHVSRCWIHGYSDLTDSDEVSSVQITGWGSQLAGRIQGMTIQLKECLWGKNPIKYKERRNQGVSRCMEAESTR